MSELREDFTTKDWVVFATERARRPHDFRQHAPQPTAGARDADCPFCPGNESKTPPEVERSRLTTTADGWDARVIPNRFAAFVPDGQPTRHLHGGHFRSMTGTGAHEVVIETPHHARPIPDMADDEVSLMFQAYQRRYHAIRALPGVQVVVVFKNYGEAAGTSLAHPHSQIRLSGLRASCASGSGPPAPPYRRPSRHRARQRSGARIHAPSGAHMLAATSSG